MPVSIPLFHLPGKYPGAVIRQAAGPGGALAGIAVLRGLHDLRNNILGDGRWTLMAVDTIKFSTVTGLLLTQRVNCYKQATNN